MPNPSKIKGSRFERELRDWLLDRGYEAERARGSDGRSLGCSAEVDVVVRNASPQRIQAKRRKAIPAYLRIPQGADCVVFREDRGTL